jgi:hypothetical protein
MLRASAPRLPHFAEGSPNYLRANQRRLKLERRRLNESVEYVPPTEPRPDEARRLYRNLLRTARATLIVTDKEYFRLKLRHEFEVTARQTSSRVRGLMFEKGMWMLRNKLGGLV